MNTTNPRELARWLIGPYADDLGSLSYPGLAGPDFIVQVGGYVIDKGKKRKIGCRVVAVTLPGSLALFPVQEIAQEILNERKVRQLVLW